MVYCQYRFFFALRFDYDDPQFRQNVEDVDALFNYLSFTMPENFLPILEYLPGSKVMKKISLIVLFVLILYIPSTIFQIYRDGSSWVEPVLSQDNCFLLKNHNAVTPVRLEPVAFALESSTKPHCVSWANTFFYSGTIQKISYRVFIKYFISIQHRNHMKNK